jgi:hypothetical protein
MLLNFLNLHRSSRLTVLLVPILLSFPAFANETWSQFEITTAYSGSIISGAWAESNGSYGQPMRCAFGILDSDGQTWKYITYHQNASYGLSANPTISIDSSGVLHAVCMSAKFDYSKGVLEYSRSSDGGKNWNPFVEIATVENGIPDKPWIQTNHQGHLVVVFARIQLDKTPSTFGLNSQTHYVESTDNGNTWLPPKEIPSPPKIRPPSSPVSYRGFQGQWIDYEANAWSLSIAEYGGGGVYFCRASSTAKLCKDPVLVGEHTNTAPITQIFRGSDPNTFGVLWYGAHKFESAGYSITHDGGKTWLPQTEVSKLATTAFAVLKGQDVYILLTEKKGKGIQSKIMKFHIDGNFLKEAYLSSEVEFSENTYFGAYQSAILRGYSRSILNFYIDYSGLQHIKIKPLILF